MQWLFLLGNTLTIVTANIIRDWKLVAVINTIAATNSSLKLIDDCLMAEMTHASEYHRNTVLISGRNGLIITHRTTWLNDS